MQTPDEIKQIELIYPNHTVVPATFSLWDDYAETPSPDILRLALCFDGREIVSYQETYWEALCAIRAELETEGILVGCYGGSRNVYPSGMCLGTGSGSVAYQTQVGQPARTTDLVNIFDTGPDIDPATLAEQKDFHNQWLSHFTQSSKPL